MIQGFRLSQRCSRDSSSLHLHPGHCQSNTGNNTGKLWTLIMDILHLFPLFRIISGLCPAYTSNSDPLLSFMLHTFSHNFSAPHLIREGFKWHTKYDRWRDGMSPNERIHLLTSEENKAPVDINRWCTCYGSSLNESWEVDVEIKWTEWLLMRSRYGGFHFNES